MITPHSPYKYGYYQVNGRQTFSKIEALEWAKGALDQVTWHYNDEAFSSMDWTKEPTKSLPELYMERARDIREAYDYVVLFYSGGSDSHNMLESFIHAGAKVDELCSYISRDKGESNELVPDDKNEIHETASPIVKKLKDDGRLEADVIHRIINLKDLIMDFSSEVNWHDFAYMVNSMFTVQQPVKDKLRNYVPEWRKLINEGKRVAFVWGWEKPRIMHDGKFYLTFYDVLNHCVGPETQRLNQAGWYDELFYHTPDKPEIAIKQGHVTKNFLNAAPETHPWFTETPTGFGHVIKHRPDHSWTAKWISQEAQAMLIYPWYDPYRHSEAKSKDSFYSQRDLWFWKDEVLSTNWRKVIEGVVHQFGEELATNTDSQFGRRVKVIRTKRYWLE